MRDQWDDALDRPVWAALTGPGQPLDSALLPARSPRRSQSLCHWPVAERLVFWLAKLSASALAALAMARLVD